MIGALRLQRPCSAARPPAIACAMAENPSRLTVAEVKDLIDRGEPIAFIDSRNPIAWGSSKVTLPGARRIPIDEVERHLPALPRDRRLIVYCT
jgi:rhodanese-related sulfurtransferase